jgi:hypothetical protein
VKVKIVVTGASGVERRSARRATELRGEIRADGELRLANPADDGSLVQLIFDPPGRVMALELLVTKKARVVPIAAFEPDGDDVEIAVIVHATSLVVD